MAETTTTVRVRQADIADARALLTEYSKSNPSALANADDVERWPVRKLFAGLVKILRREVLDGE